MSKDNSPKANTSDSEDFSMDEYCKYLREIQGETRNDPLKKGAVEKNAEKPTEACNQDRANAADRGAAGQSSAKGKEGDGSEAYDPVKGIQQMTIAAKPYDPVRDSASNR
ncbi:hypothetical protein OCU04_004968 [Sclerotinia nivalis]|uniref:Uncharacterized protein n=1 Tax=Sclerotinia nivalis TaxID=352851 RepID=A0A9X0DJH0_9HELO|nr:hypothetical protein OCU04_004968 [Sclerotinia nivalis]